MPFIKFVEIEQKHTKTRQFYVSDVHRNILGYIIFFPQWRKFVFKPERDTIYDFSCLKEISEFCEKTTKEWKDDLKEWKDDLKLVKEEKEEKEEREK